MDSLPGPTLGLASDGIKLRQSPGPWSLELGRRVCILIELELPGTSKKVEFRLFVHSAYLNLHLLSAEFSNQLDADEGVGVAAQEAPSVQKQHTCPGG